MSWNSLKGRLVCAVIAVVGICAVVNAISSYATIRDLSMDRLRSSFKQDVEQRANLIGNWTSKNKSLMTALANAIMDGRDIDTALRMVGESAGIDTVSYSPQQGDIHTILGTEFPEDYDPTVRPWYQLALQRGKTSMTAPFYNQVGVLGWNISFVAPVKENDTVIGVAMSRLTMDDIYSVIKRDNSASEGFYFLVDHSGNVLVHAQEEFINQPITGVLEHFTTRDLDSVFAGDVIENVAVNNKDYFLTAIPLPDSDWYLMAGIGLDTIYQDLNQMLRNTVLAALGIMVTLVVVGTLTINKLLSPLQTVRVAMSNIAEGNRDLTRRLTENGLLELVDLSKSFNSFVDKIHQVIIRVLHTSDSLKLEANGMQAEAQESNRYLQNQQYDVVQVASAITQMSQAASEISANANAASDTVQKTAVVSNEAMGYAQDNAKKMQELVVGVKTSTDTMRELEHQSQQIGSILATIQNIAEQTNLLALNAAIESARAGEQGRGFAVVADEVRTLSQRTHQATGEIQNMIESLQSCSKKAAALLGQSVVLAESTMENTSFVTDSLHNINATIQSIADITTHISTACEQQKIASEEIDRNTSSIQNVTTELVAIGEKALVRSTLLNHLGQTIHSDLHQFKIG